MVDRLEAKGGVYQVICRATGARYIGCTCDFSQRERQHFGFLRRGDHQNKEMQIAFDLHGESNFLFLIIASFGRLRAERVGFLEREIYKEALCLESDYIRSSNPDLLFNQLNRPRQSLNRIAA